MLHNTFRLTHGGQSTPSVSLVNAGMHPGATAKIAYAAAGHFSGGKISIEESANAVNWSPVAGLGVLESAAGGTFALAAKNNYYRATLSGKESDVTVVFMQ